MPVVCGLIAIVPATPSTLDGLCGPGQRNGVGFFSEERERRSATVDCFRLVVVLLILQTRSREELRLSMLLHVRYVRVQRLHA
jgi:hypothetical protein